MFHGNILEITEELEKTQDISLFEDWLLVKDWKVFKECIKEYYPTKVKNKWKLYSKGIKENLGDAIKTDNIIEKIVEEVKIGKMIQQTAYLPYGLFKYLTYKDKLEFEAKYKYLFYALYDLLLAYTTYRQEILLPVEQQLKLVKGKELTKEMAHIRKPGSEAEKLEGINILEEVIGKAGTVSGFKYKENNLAKTRATEGSER